MRKVETILYFIVASSLLLGCTLVMTDDPNIPEGENDVVGRLTNVQNIGRGPEPINEHEENVIWQALINVFGNMNNNPVKK